MVKLNTNLAIQLQGKKNVFMGGGWPTLLMQKLNIINTFYTKCLALVSITID